MNIRTAVGAALLAALASQTCMAQDTLKIGAVVTLSGAGAAWGTAMKNAAEWAADKVNATGGLEVAGKKYKVVVVPYDDKYQAGEAMTVATRLVFDDAAKYIIGPTGSAAAVAIQPVTEKNKVIIMTMAFTPKAIGTDKPYSFRPLATTVEFSQPQIDWVVKAYGVKKVGSLFPNDETGQTVARDLQAAYKKAGSAITQSEFFERDRVDFVPLITRMMASGIDAIELNGNAPTTAGLIIKQARELGFTGKFIRTGGPATPELVNVAGKAAVEGTIVHAPIDPNLASTKAYLDAYQAKYKAVANGFSPSFYDATNLLFEAMRRAGTVTDTSKVRDELEKIGNFQGALGSLSWTGKASYGIDHQLSIPFYIAEIKDGADVIRARCTVDGCK
ncbi:ABC transporter substrate-binding protein [soil metagenome]